MRLRKKHIAILLLPFIAFGIISLVKQRSISTVRAFGYLNVDLGVPSGDPIFVVSNMLPGDCQSRTISVENTAEGISTALSVRSANIVNNANLASVMDMTISENSSVLYQSTLEQFFVDSQTLDGVPLSTLPGGSVKNYDFEICFHPSAGNEYQRTEVIFDLLFGEVISPLQLPDECRHLEGKILFKVEGTDGDDDLRTEDVSELILGYGGNDQLDGQKGDDCIVGGEGNDEIDGGDENDVIIGGPGDDILDGEDNNDIVYGNEGDDDIEGGHGDDILYGGSGNDYINGRSDNDTIYGDEGNDEIDGGSGNDKIYGGSGDDEIDGASGDDIIDGEDDNDTVDGGTGTDQCFGEVIDSCEL